MRAALAPVLFASLLVACNDAPPEIKRDPAPVPAKAAPTFSPSAGTPSAAGT